MKRQTGTDVVAANLEICFRLQENIKKTTKGFISRYRQDNIYKTPKNYIEPEVWLFKDQDPYGLDWGGLCQTLINDTKIAYPYGLACYNLVKGDLQGRNFGYDGYLFGFQEQSIEPHVMKLTKNPLFTGFVLVNHGNQESNIFELGDLPEYIATIGYGFRVSPFLDYLMSFRGEDSPEGDLVLDLKRDSFWLFKDNLQSQDLVNYTKGTDAQEVSENLVNNFQSLNS